jgi:predicted nucleic acid-binding protein
MSQYTALLDANVLYPAPLRDILLQMTVADLFRAKWSADIHKEWIEALLRNEPHRDRATLERLRNLMDGKTRDSLVTGYEDLIPSLQLPDPDDRHVLAAAIIGRCDVIVTKNLKHFPDNILKKYEIDKLHPDEFLLNQLNLYPVRFCAELRKIRARLRKPPYTVEEYLETLTRQELGTTVADLRRFMEDI